MSVRHPVIVVTGSSGAGTTSVRNTFQQIFRREKVQAAYIEGDAFHRYDRAGMRRENRRGGGTRQSSFQPFRPGRQPAGRAGDAVPQLRRFRHRPHPPLRARRRRSRALRRPARPFHRWQDLETPTDLLFYEGLHGAVVADGLDLARHADLKIGVVPVINLEWIQKIHRDRNTRGYSTEDVMATILRRMPDYAHYICPQFTQTDINFQRIPTVDTSNPFIARWIPTPDESMVVIRFRNPRGIDFPYLLSMLAGSFMSRANTIVIPGNKLDLAMQLILTPLILRLIERQQRSQ